jgi:hypothetical protein
MICIIYLIKACTIEKGKVTERWRRKAKGAKAVSQRYASQLPGSSL